MTLVVRPRWAPVQDEDVVRLLVVAFDPGVGTGWAALRLDLGLLVTEGFAALALRSGGGRETDLLAWDTGTFRGGDGACADQMLALCRGVWEEAETTMGADSDVLGIAQEDFILRMMSSDRDLLSPVRINAVFDYIARPVPIPRRKQQPSDAKRVVSDDRLHKLNLWRSGWEDHEKDALRHAVLLARAFCEPAFLARWCAASAWMRDDGYGLDVG